MPTRTLTGDNALLKLDLDRRRPPSIRRLRFLLGRAGYRLGALVMRRSPSGRGWHVWIETDPRPRHPAEVVALQSILGSDPTREAVTLYRGMAWQRTPAFAREWWNVLYTPDRARTRRLKLERR